MKILLVGEDRATNIGQGTIAYLPETGLEKTIFARAWAQAKGKMPLDDNSILAVASRSDIDTLMGALDAALAARVPQEVFIAGAPVCLSLGLMKIISDGLHAILEFEE